MAWVVIEGTRKYLTQVRECSERKYLKPRIKRNIKYI